MADRIVLVEGPSDEAAVKAVFAKAPHREALDVDISNVGGAGGFVDGVGRVFASHRSPSRMAILCDEAELQLAQTGIANTVAAKPNSIKTFVCRPDLEFEMINTLGEEAILRLFETQGELAGFRTLQNQPAWRDASRRDQIHRFLGVKAQRKIRYGQLLAAALEPRAIPSPLQQLVDWIYG